MTTLLIDADILLFKACVVCEREINWDDEITTIHSPDQDVRENIKRIFGRWMMKLKADRAIMALTSPDNYRNDIAEDYKANRGGLRKPIGYKVALDWIRENHEVQTIPRLEADDVLGILATAGKITKPIIVSDDKDLKQIPGTLYRPNDDEVSEITPEQGFRWHMKQTLIGDQTDNYPGCPRIGAVTADKLIDEAAVEDVWPLVTDKFDKAGLSVDYALLQARLAKILQAHDYDKKRKAPILWNPHTDTVIGAAAPSRLPAAAPKNVKPARPHKETSPQPQRMPRKHSTRAKAAKSIT